MKSSLIAALSFLFAVLPAVLPVSPILQGWIALFSLFATAIQWRSPRSGRISFLGFFPAFLAAAWSFRGIEASAPFLVPLALAFQLRLCLLRLGQRIQGKRDALAHALEQQSPEQATVFVDNDIQSEVKANALREGHAFRVMPGQVIPADGIVTFGSSVVNEAMLPGQKEILSMKGMGSRVLAGTLNKTGSLVVHATAVGDRTFSYKLATRIRYGKEIRLSVLLAFDLGFSALALLFKPKGEISLPFILLASGTSSFALLQGFEWAIAQVAVVERWLFTPRRMRRLARAGVLVMNPKGSLTEGRPKLAAIECTSQIGEDAAITLLGPLARKLETPQAFALLQEMRVRNLPLQQSEFFQAGEDGGFALVGGEDISWLQFPKEESLGSLKKFVDEQRNAGHEMVFLERNGSLQAAFAFEDPAIAGVADSAASLRAASFPIYLSSSAPKFALEHLQRELGIEEIQAEAIDADVESLLRQLRQEKRNPLWVQGEGKRPEGSHLVISLPSAHSKSADLVVPELGLPYLAKALLFARRQSRALFALIAYLLASQALLLGATLIFSLHPLLCAVLGVLPGFLGLAIIAKRKATG